MMVRKYFLIMFTAICICVENTSSNIASTPTPANKPVHKIAFISTRDGWPAPYIMNSDGSEKKPLRGKLDGVLSNSITWSPDGYKVAFPNSHYNDNGDCEIQVVEINTGQSKVIPIDKGEVTTLICDPIQWLPGGNRIAFISNRDGISKLYTVDIESRELVRITSDLLDDVDFSWSPTGNDVAVYSEDQLHNKEPSGLYIINDMQKERRWLVDAKSFTWFPDGRHIVYTTERNKEFLICINDVAGTHEECLSHIEGVGTGADFYSPNVSPDGKSILFTIGTIKNPASTANTGVDIYVMDSNFKNIRRLTTSVENSGIVDNFDPVWSPDGDYIIYGRGYYGYGGEKYIYRMNANGENQRRLTFDTNSVNPVWQP